MSNQDKIDWGKTVLAAVLSAVITSVGTGFTVAYMMGRQTARTEQRLDQQEHVTAQMTINVSRLTDKVSELDRWKSGVEASRFTSKDGAVLLETWTKGQNTILLQLTELRTEQSYTQKQVADLTRKMEAQAR